MKNIQIFILLLIGTASDAQAWKLIGNSGTNPSLNFVGTTDTVTLQFRVNNKKSGLIDYNSFSAHTAFGFQALSLNSTGKYNSAFGYMCLLNNTTGSNNTANGFKALYSNSNGNANTGVGYQALTKNVSGAYNTAVGQGALQENTNGNYNTAVGLFSLALNTTGLENTATGANALENNTTGSYNTASGRYALRSNTTGTYNSANGHSALYSNTTGSNNSCNGYFSMYKNTVGVANTAGGYRSLYNNLSGDFNTAVGYKSMDSNANGSYNTAVGASALYGINNTGKYNTASGYSALKNNISGNGNSAAGSYALANNTTGFSNTAHGYYALYANTTGQGNTALGDSALYSNTKGYGNSAVGLKTLYSNLTGNRNTATGDSVLYTNVSGRNNTANGYAALFRNTGNENTAMGSYALYKNTNGANNTAIGTETLYENTNGSQNTAIGWKAGIVGNYNNTVCLGYTAAASADNQVRIGNTLTSSIGGFEDWSNISDARVKKNIKPNVPGLSFINKLMPVTYNLDLSAADKILKRNSIQNEMSETNKLSANEISAMNAKQQAIYTGFVAQDVERAAKEINYNFSGVDVAKNENDLYGLRYAAFVVPLVKAVQELSAANDIKDAALIKQEKINAGLQKQIDDLKALLISVNNIQQTSTNGQKIIMSSPVGSLEQNAPNPFRSATVIRYHVPASVSNAQIIVTNAGGKTIKTFTIDNKEAGSITIKAGELAAGSYYYILLVDGKKTDSKQMVLLK